MTDTLLLESPGVRVRRFAFPVPDALLALIFAPMVERSFLLMQGMLVHIAMRVRRRPFPENPRVLFRYDGLGVPSPEPW